ncbi:MAG: hypothetical protein ACTHMP_14500 [Thermomicrobiales bacterium]
MYEPQQPAKPPSNVFEKFMLTITGMSALAILFLMLLPVLACIGIGALCLLSGIGASHGFPTPTP